jgi:hypothetical protein
LLEVRHTEEEREERRESVFHGGDANEVQEKDDKKEADANGRDINDPIGYLKER